MIKGVSDKPENLAASLATGPQRPPAETQHAPARGTPPSAPASNEPAPGAKASDPVVADTVEQVNNALQRQSGNRLSLSVDKDTNRVIVKYKDPQTGEVVRQFPPETILKMAKQLDKLKGIMLDSKG